MENQTSLPTRLPEFITAVYPWMHGHQVKATALFLAALLVVQSCKQAVLASHFLNKVAALRRLTRWLHNDRLDAEALAAGAAAQLVSRLPAQVCVRLALDWTREGQQHVLVAALLVGRRAVPLYWRVYAEGSFKGHRSWLERAFIQRVITQFLRSVPRHLILVTADRGFADVKFFDLLDHLGVGFVVRTKDNLKIYQARHWRKLKTLKWRGNTRQQAFGRLRYCERTPRRYYLFRSRARDRQGRWGVWWLVSNWDLTVTQATQEYARRWGCECGFRDLKHLLGLRAARIADTAAYARMFALAALTLLLLAIMGCAFLQLAQAPQQMLRRTGTVRATHPELSFFAAILHLLKHLPTFWDYLLPEVKLNLDVDLRNVS